jgi:hypothetical protein
VTPRATASERAEISRISRHVFTDSAPLGAVDGHLSITCPNRNRERRSLSRGSAFGSALVASAAPGSGLPTPANPSSRVYPTLAAGRTSGPGDSATRSAQPRRRPIPQRASLRRMPIAAAYRSCSTVWVDGPGNELRSIAKVLNEVPPLHFAKIMKPRRPKRGPNLLE